MMMIKFFTVSQVAEMYSVSPRKVYRDINRGFLPAVTVAGAVRVREPDAKGYAKDLNPYTTDVGRAIRRVLP